jgi:hypothetical protein
MMINRLLGCGGQQFEVDKCNQERFYASQKGFSTECPPWLPPSDAKRARSARQVVFCALLCVQTGARQVQTPEKVARICNPLLYT